MILQNCRFVFVRVLNLGFRDNPNIICNNSKIKYNQPETLGIHLNLMNLPEETLESIAQRALGDISNQ